MEPEELLRQIFEKRSEDIDYLEQISWDLEAAQQKRHAKAKGSDEFWTATEMKIFELIKSYRQRSSTFDPNNYR